MLNTVMVCAALKVAVEVKAEQLADKGYKMLGAPYFEEQRGCWCYRLEKPAHLKQLKHREDAQ